MGRRWGVVEASLGRRWGVVGTSLGRRWSVAGASLRRRWGFAEASLASSRGNRSTVPEPSAKKQRTRSPAVTPERWPAEHQSGGTSSRGNRLTVPEPSAKKQKTHSPAVSPHCCASRRRSGGTSSSVNGSAVPEARPGCKSEPGLCLGNKGTALFEVSGCYTGTFCEACLRVLKDEASRLGKVIQMEELEPQRGQGTTVDPVPRPPEAGEVPTPRWCGRSGSPVAKKTLEELCPLTPQELRHKYGPGYELLSKMGGNAAENRLRPDCARLESASSERKDQEEGGAVDSPGLRQFLLEHGLQDHCYVSHIAANYFGDDRRTKSKKGKFEKWLKQLSFLEHFIDETQNVCVRMRAPYPSGNRP